MLVKHTAYLLKQLPYFVNIDFQKTQDWRNAKLIEHAGEEEVFR